MECDNEIFLLRSLFATKFNSAIIFFAVKFKLSFSALTFSVRDTTVHQQFQNIGRIQSKVVH